MEISYIGTNKLLNLVPEHGAMSKETRRTWSFVHRENGTVALSPTRGPRYLYRGQAKRYSPCLPSIARPVKKPGRTLGELPRDEALVVVANLVRAEWYCSQLESHPAFEWAASKGIAIPRIEFAQHYGIPTGLIDMTESLEVALFFATHEFINGLARPCPNGTGILYRIDWASAPEAVSRRFKPIYLQPFPRPFRQWAWSCELMLGESFEACPGLVAVEFPHDESFANDIRSLAELHGRLFPDDIMADVAVVIREATVFPKSIAERVVADIVSDPGGVRETPENLLDALKGTGVVIADATAPIFDDTQVNRLQEMWREQKPSWEAAFAEGFEQLLVRNTKAAQPAAGADR